MSDKPAEQAYHARGAGREAEALAKAFHEAYERLAPQFGYETRKESAVAWADVPERNRKLMIAVCAELREPGADTGTTPSRDCVWIVEQNGEVHSVHSTYESAFKEEGENLRIGGPWQVLPWREAERGTTPPPSTAEFEPLLRGELKHGRSCPAVGAPMDEGNCDCGLKWRIRLQTEMTLRNAWEKRAYEAEAALAAAERGTTPPEGLAFTFEEFIDMSLRHNKRLAAGISGIASFGHWYNEMLAATQRAPVEQGQVVEIMEKFREYRLWHEDQISYLAKKWRAKTYKHDGVTLTYDEDFLYGRETCADDLESMFKQENQATAPDHAREVALRVRVEALLVDYRGILASLKTTMEQHRERVSGFTTLEAYRHHIDCTEIVVIKLERALADGKEGQ